MRIAFFIRQASRTGSVVALCNLISYAVRNGLEACVACREDGEILTQLPPDVPVVAYNKWSGTQRRYAGMMRRLRGDGNGFTSYVHSKYSPDIWYVNSIIQPDVILEAKRKRFNCVLHSHELEHMLVHLSESETTTLVSYPQLILASSKASLEVLRGLGRRENLEVCYESINPALITSDSDTTMKLRRELGIGDQTFVWAMAGTLDPNKNPSRFVSIAVEVLNKGHNVHFIWLGGFDTGYGLYAKQLARNSGFGSKITFLGPRTTDCYDWLNASNGIVITSFKDCFPLVIIEAAYLGKPVVSFNSGGVKEFIHDGMGMVIDSWNDRDLIDAMLRVMRGEIAFDHERAKNRALEFSVDVQGKRWLDLLTNRFPR